jgi:hypothetical protein
MVEIQPTPDHPIPFDLSDEQPKTHKDGIAIAVNTVNMIEELGASIDFSNKDLHKAEALIKGVEKSQEPRHITTPSEAKAASELVKKFDFHAFSDIHQARNYITNKLLQISDCGDPKLELKALELLGKHSDIGIFTERSEITITHKTSTDLENSIKERIKRLLHADVVDVEPLISELEEEKAPVLEQNEPIEGEIKPQEGENGGN